jgi:phosphatidylglycerophosphatase A
MDRLTKIFHYSIATALGSGYFPKAPGTAGSLFALLLIYLFPTLQDTLIYFIVFFTIVGIWSAGFVENEKGDDPSIVVIDEVVGQWIALLFIPFTIIPTIIAFILFRLFDIFKPFPIYQSQSLKGGFGIMVDDIIAGIFANIILQIIIYTGFIK